MTKIRQKTDESNRYSIEQFDTAFIDIMVKYFTRQDDHESIKSAIITRYGVGIERVLFDPKSPSSGDYEVYKKGAFEDQVNAGMIGEMCIGFSTKIIGALATLFTEDGQKFVYTHDSKEDISEATELLLKSRAQGGFDASITECDEQSVGIGSSAILIGFSNNHLNYEIISKAQVYFMFADMIESDDRTRPVNCRDEEDATYIVIRLSQIPGSIVSYKFLAIFGRSVEYPQGRYVMYTADSEMAEIPPEGDSEAIDWVAENGEIANPLSYWANLHPDDNVPEYPIAILDGGVTQGTDPMPVTQSLFKNCLEIDVGASHLLGTSQDAARGTLAVMRDHQGQNTLLPRSLSGPVDLGIGLSLEHISHNAADSLTAFDVLDRLMVHLGSGYSVPDYMINKDGINEDTSSGVALEIKTRPLIRERNKRISKNRQPVRKIFEIEKSLIGLHHTGDDAAVNTLVECQQVWDPGKIKIPENRNEMADRMMKLSEMGVLDQLGAIQEYFQLSTLAEAEELYEKMKERQAGFPPLVKEEQPAKQLGLPPRLR